MASISKNKRFIFNKNAKESALLTSIGIANKDHAGATQHWEARLRETLQHSAFSPSGDAKRGPGATLLTEDHSITQPCVNGVIYFLTQVSEAPGPRPGLLTCPPRVAFRAALRLAVASRPGEKAL